MNRNYQNGTIRVSVLINTLLGIGILGAVAFLLFENTKQASIVQPVTAYTAPSPINNEAAAPAGGQQIDQLKSKLEIETLKLERLRIQTERVRASQRRAQSVLPDEPASLTTVEAEPALDINLTNGSQNQTVNSQPSSTE